MVAFPDADGSDLRRRDPSEAGTNHLCGCPRKKNVDKRFTRVVRPGRLAPLTVVFKWRAWRSLSNRACREAPRGAPADLDLRWALAIG